MQRHFSTGAAQKPLLALVLVRIPSPSSVLYSHLAQQYLRLDISHSGKPEAASDPEDHEEADDGEDEGAGEPAATPPPLSVDELDIDTVSRREGGGEKGRDLECVNIY